jgi:hypothetical protein
MKLIDEIKKSVSFFYAHFCLSLGIIICGVKKKGGG